MSIYLSLNLGWSSHSKGASMHAGFDNYKALITRTNSGRIIHSSDRDCIWWLRGHCKTLTLNLHVFKQCSLRIICVVENNISHWHWHVFIFNKSTELGTLSSIILSCHRTWVSLQNWFEYFFNKFVARIRASSILKSCFSRTVAVHIKRWISNKCSLVDVYICKNKISSFRRIFHLNINISFKKDILWSFSIAHKFKSSIKIASIQWFDYN